MRTVKDYLEDVRALVVARVKDPEMRLNVASVPLDVCPMFRRTSLKDFLYAPHPQFIGAVTMFRPPHNHIVNGIAVFTHAEGKRPCPHSLAYDLIHELAHVVAGFQAHHEREWQQVAEEFGLRNAPQSITPQSVCEGAEHWDPEMLAAVHQLEPPSQ